eukprot:786836-Pelagomonas_calceolata.AAC.2
MQVVLHTHSPKASCNNKLRRYVAKLAISDSGILPNKEVPSGRLDAWTKAKEPMLLFPDRGGVHLHV